MHKVFRTLSFNIFNIKQTGKQTVYEILCGQYLKLLSTIYRYVNQILYHMAMHLDARINSYKVTKVVKMYISLYMNIVYYNYLCSKNLIYEVVTNIIQ